MPQEHLCTFLKEQNCAAIYKDDPYWILLLYKEATEDDLESNHYLETVGESIEEIRVPIICCPYCGEKLQSKSVIEKPSYQYIDYSKW